MGNHLFSWESDRSILLNSSRRFCSCLASAWLTWVDYPKLKNTHIHTHIIVARCTLHKIYHLNHFKVYSSVVLNIFTLSCNQSLPCKTESIPIKQQLPVSSSHQPLATTIYFVSLSLTTLGTSFKWNHTVFLFCDWLIEFSMTSSRLIQVIAYVRISFLFKAEKYSIVCIYHILFLHQWTFGFLLPFDYCEYCCYEHGLQIFLRPWTEYPEVELLDLTVILFLIF